MTLIILKTRIWNSGKKPSVPFFLFYWYLHPQVKAVLFFCLTVSTEVSIRGLFKKLRNILNFPAMVHFSVIRLAALHNFTSVQMLLDCVLTSFLVPMLLFEYKVFWCSRRVSNAKFCVKLGKLSRKYFFYISITYLRRAFVLHWFRGIYRVFFESRHKYCDNFDT